MASLTLIFTRPVEPNGLVGRKVQTDLVKISVKEAMHMGFYCIMSSKVSQILNYIQCQYTEQIKSR